MGALEVYALGQAVQCQYERLSCFSSAEDAYEHVAESEAEAEDEEQGSLPASPAANGDGDNAPAANGNGGYLPVETDEGDASGDENT
jgi:hypothetical protein